MSERQTVSVPSLLIEFANPLGSALVHSFILVHFLLCSRRRTKEEWWTDGNSWPRISPTSGKKKTGGWGRNICARNWSGKCITLKYWNKCPFPINFLLLLPPLLTVRFVLFFNYIGNGNNINGWVGRSSKWGDDQGATRTDGRRKRVITTDTYTICSPSLTHNCVQMWWNDPTGAPT